MTVFIAIFVIDLFLLFLYVSSTNFSTLTGVEFRWLKMDMVGVRNMVLVYEFLEIHFLNLNSI